MRSAEEWKLESRDVRGVDEFEILIETNSSSFICSFARLCTFGLRRALFTND